MLGGVGKGLAVCTAAMSILFLCIIPARGQSGPGVLTGQVFTAQHPDSVLQHGQVDLIFRGANGEIQRRSGETDHFGAFSFAGLDTTSTLAYVLGLQGEEGELVSEPIFFPTGQGTLVYNLLASTEFPSMPAGHPSITPSVGTVPRDLPAVTFVIVLLLALLFAFFFRLSGAMPERSHQRAYPQDVQSLMRDVASLDLRHERGEIGGEEYTKIRHTLRERLIEFVRSNPLVSDRKT